MNRFEKIEIKISACGDKPQDNQTLLAEKLQYMEHTRAIAQIRQEIKRTQGKR